MSDRLPDLVIGGEPVSRAELAAAPASDPTAHLCTGDIAARDPHAERDRFAAHLVKHGNTPDYATATARKTAERHDRRYSHNRIR